MAKVPTLFKIIGTKTTVLALHLQQVENYSELYKFGIAVYMQTK